MREDEIQVFIGTILDYFSSIDEQTPKVSSPYLTEGVDGSLMEFTGMIGITGRNEGTVLFTAPKTMLIQLLGIYGETGTSPELLMDLVGELANTIAGNAREVFGAKFELAPPVTVRGPIKDIRVARGLQTYCVPFYWRERKAALIVSLT